MIPRPAGRNVFATTKNKPTFFNKRPRLNLASWGGDLILGNFGWRLENGKGYFKLENNMGVWLLECSKDNQFWSDLQPWDDNEPWME